MTHTFRKGDRVVTTTGNTRGEVVEVPDPDHIDVLGDSGNRYRQCIASKWQFEASKPKTPQYGPLKRGDRCHINLALPEDEPFGPITTMSGTVVGATTDSVYVQFDGDASRWIKRPFAIRGEGAHDL